MARVVHFELPTSDSAASMAFFKEVFGWWFEKYGNMEYFLTMTGDPKTPGIDGGLGGAANGFNATVVTVDVENLDESLAKALANGAQVVMPKDEVPGAGFLAYIREPGGAVLGMFQALPGMSY